MVILNQGPVYIVLLQMTGTWVSRPHHRVTHLKCDSILTHEWCIIRLPPILISISLHTTTHLTSTIKVMYSFLPVDLHFYILKRWWPGEDLDGTPQVDGAICIHWLRPVVVFADLVELVGIGPWRERQTHPFAIVISWAEPGLILGLHPANERRRYNVTPSLIGRV